MRALRMLTIWLGTLRDGLRIRRPDPRLSLRAEERMEMLAEIRRKFSNPASATAERYHMSTEYCVGGGISLYDKPHLRGVAQLRFPQDKVLASVLQYRNPHLSAE